MIGLAWECADLDSPCGATGTGPLPDVCPTCEGRTRPTRESGAVLEDVFAWMHSRAAEVACRLGFDEDNVTFQGGQFKSTWESANCRCGCSGYSTHTEYFPFAYLWLTDQEIYAKKAEREDAEAQKKAAAERKVKLERATWTLQQAQRRAVSAQKDALADLAQAEAALAALRGSTP